MATPYDGWVQGGGGLSWGDTGLDIYWFNPATGQTVYQQPEGFGAVTPEQIAALAPQWGPMAQTIAALEAQGWTNLRPAAEGDYTAPGSGAFVTLYGDHPYYGTNAVAGTHEEGTDTDFGDFAQTVAIMAAAGYLGGYGTDYGAGTGAEVYGGLDSAAVAGADYGYGAGAVAGGGGQASLVGEAPYSDPIVSGNYGTGTEGTTVGVNDAGAYDATGSLGTNATNGVGGTGYNFADAGLYEAGTGGVAGGGAGAGTSGSVISNMTGMDPSTVQLLGTLGSTALGVYGANEQSNAYSDLANQLRTDRLPFLNQSLAWLYDPSLYYQSGPAQASMDAVLRGLSVHGNPAGNPAAQAVATQVGLNNWQNAVLGFGNVGLGGQNIQANLGSNAINAEGGIYDSIGYGIGQMTQPQRNNTFDDFWRSYQRSRTGL